tara:strand:+ start:76 stop:267 length:192 start_codon:yes stop_codon:yes gene_type:complete
MTQLQQDWEVLYYVVIQDKLTKKPIEYACFDNEYEATKLMVKIISSGSFAAVAKKRIKVDDIS